MHATRAQYPWAGIQNAEVGSVVFTTLNFTPGLFLVGDFLVRVGNTQK